MELRNYMIVCIVFCYRSHEMEIYISHMIGKPSRASSKYVVCNQIASRRYI